MDLHYREVPSDVPTLLNELELTNFIPTFQEHLITFDMLEGLSYSEWLSLLPPLGARKKLSLLYPNATGSQADTIPISRTSEVSIEVEDPSRMVRESANKNDCRVLEGPPEKKLRRNPKYFMNDVSLQEFLERDARTSELMNLFDFESGWLDDAQRSVIVRTIADGLLERHQIVTQEMKNDVAQEICLIFKNESPHVYFQFGRKKNEEFSISGNTSTNACGRLHDRLVNEGTRRRRILKSLKPKGPAQCIPAPDKEAIQSKGWLKYHCSPLDVVRVNWEKTYQIRKDEASNDSQFQVFLKEWSILKNSNIGPELVSLLLIV